MENQVEKYNSYELIIALISEVLIDVQQTLKAGDEID